MNIAAWHATNERYLSGGLNWLRLRLRRMIEQAAAPISTAPVRRGGVLRGNDTTVETVSVAQIEAAAQAMRECETGEVPPALLILSERLGLSAFERHILLLCAAMELDTRIAGLCAQAQDNPARAYPTFALVLALFDEPSWDALAPDRPLRYWRLLEINQSGAQPLTTSALRADERIVNYLKGLNSDVDDRLETLVMPLGGDDGRPLPESQAHIMRRISSALRTTPPPIIQLTGSDSMSKRLVALRATTSLGLLPYRLAGDWMPTAGPELENFIRLWQRETLLLPVVLYLEARIPPGDARTSALTRVLENTGGFIFLDINERWPDLARASVVIETARPTSEEQEAVWLEEVGAAAPDSPAALANQFNLNLPHIRQIAETALIEGYEGADERLWDGCLSHARRRMDNLAQRIDVKAGWDDLVLPDEQKDLLCQIVNQVRLRNAVYRRWNFRQKMNRGLGVNALFAGESGTGKTMAAEVIAHALRLHLYRIDLSTVISKYIGETEKNLAALFDEASTGGMVLFFDEADALFGKRSEVKDSHDRYANIEINYLLQRMESFEGLAILATNMKSALDEAFMRRLRFVIQFPFPGKPERKQMWQKAFPPPAYGPPPELDYDWLARFNLTGGNIYTIALNAAFLAEQRGTNVTMTVVLEAARTELRKLEKPINEADFRWSGA